MICDCLWSFSLLDLESKSVGRSDEVHSLNLARLVGAPLPLKIGGWWRRTKRDKVCCWSVGWSLPFILIGHCLGGLSLHNLDIQRLGCSGSQWRKILQGISISQPSLILIVLVGAWLDKSEQGALLGDVNVVHLAVGLRAVSC